MSAPHWLIVAVFSAIVGLFSDWLWYRLGLGRR